MNPHAINPPSLRHLLVRRLLPAMLVILAAGAITAYGVALHSATLAYDRSLLNTALALAEQIHIVDGYPSLHLTPQAQSILLTDKYDRIFYSVRDQNDQLVSGSDLSLPPPEHNEQLLENGRGYYDSHWSGHAIRIAAFRTEKDGIPLTVLTGETLVKRNAIVRDIILGMLLPELLLVAATVALIGFGIRSGLAPLTGLLRQLAGRSQADLRPISALVPEEMQPLVVEINSLLQRLAHSLTSQRHFVSDAAHQLRTPIAALQAQVEVALRQVRSETPSSLDGILSATRRLSHLVDQLLALARAEPSQTSPLPEINLEDVIHEAAELCLPKAIAKRIDLGFEISPATLCGNHFLLRELLSNLTDNALRHTPEDGTITISCGTNGRHVWLAVEDSGPGIPEAEREKVFERFYQLAGTFSDGCGLGLAIVEAIVRQHGGTARIANSRLGGTRVEITLPAVPSSEKN